MKEKGTLNAQLSTLNSQRPAAEASRACACAREGDALPDLTAEQVANAYRDAVCGVLAVIRFGAMLVIKDMSLSRETHNGGCFQTGETLKAWLASECPDVGYKSAMRMKGTAEAVSAGLDIPAALLLRALNPDPRAICDDAEASARDRVIEIVHGRSERSLVLWLKGGAPALPHADSPAAEDTEKAEVAALDSARRFARAVSDALKCLDGRQKNTVAKDVARTLREALGLKGLAWLAKVLEEAES